MLTVHFGAGNIGRGFIGEVLNQNDSTVAFVDVNSSIIDALNERREYVIEVASEDEDAVKVDNVYGINSNKNPEAVIEAISEADLVTTAIGPKILPIIAPMVLKGIIKRKEKGIEDALDIIACENMIGGSSFLKKEVLNEIEDPGLIQYIEQFIGFPDAAVDRIVPMQTHEDVLKVTVEPYKEWVISEKGLKNPSIKLQNVHYVKALEPFIERKLFTVNTGHASTAYNGAFAGYNTIDEALKDESVYKQVQAVLEETGALMVEKWNFDKEAHEKYIDKILSRFKNPRLSDEITRVGRTPIRKLGFDERFIRPIREANERGLSVDALILTVGKAMVYNDTTDEESAELQKMLKEKDAETVVREITGLKNEFLIKRIVTAYKGLK